MRSGKAFYFIFFAAAACLVPFLTLYYQGLGLSGRQIGFLVGLVPLVNMVGSSAWGMLSDSTGRHRALFLMAIVGIWFSVLGMSRATTFEQLIPLVVLYAFFGGPIVPLVDNTVMEWVGATDGDYGRTRVWGSYGWALAGGVTGVVIERSGLEWAFYGYLILMATIILVAGRMPMSTAAIGGQFWGALRRLLANRAWLLFLGVALVEGMALGIFLNYLFPYVETLGFSRTVMGFSLTTATISEIPIFFASKGLLKRWGSPLLLAFSLFFVVVRAFAYVFMTTPLQLLLISMLHGVTFSLMWVAGVAYADRIAPAGLGATAQGVFSGLVMGGGIALGAFIGGALYDSRGGLAVFQFTGWSALAALLLFVWANRRTFARQLQLARG